MNARFWIYWNGWVKITLTPGQRFTLESEACTEEGYRTVYETYEHTGSAIECTITVNERDCDGLHDWRGDSVCTLENLSACPVPLDSTDDDDIPTTHYAPRWERVKASYRDHTAEMAGY